MVNLKDLLYECRGMREREAVGGMRRKHECKEAGFALVKSCWSPLLKASWAIIWNCFLTLTHNITCLKPQLELLEVNKPPLIFSNRGKSYLWHFGQFLKARSQQRSMTKGPLAAQQVSMRPGGDWRWILAPARYRAGAQMCVLNGQKREAACRGKCQCSKR